MLSHETLDMNRLKERFSSVDFTLKNPEKTEQLTPKKYAQLQMTEKQMMPSSLPLKKRFLNIEEVYKNPSSSIDHNQGL